MLPRMLSLNYFYSLYRSGVAFSDFQIPPGFGLAAEPNEAIILELSEFCYRLLAVLRVF